MYALVALLFLMTIFSQPLWMWVVKKFDKRIAVLSGLLTMIIGIVYILFLFITRESISTTTMSVMLIPGLAFAGGGMGALYSMPTGMLGDAIAVEKLHTKEDNTATYTGFMTFGNKLSQSVALLIIGVMLDLIGFQEGSATQEIGVQWGLGWIVFGGILASLIGGFIFYSKYDLKKKDVPDLDGVSVEEDDKTVIVGSDESFE